MSSVLLDTDALSMIMRQQQGLFDRAQIYLEEYQLFTFSIITRYEILRGLKAKNAMKQTEAFEQFCQLSQVLPLADGIVVKAAEIYGALHRQGALIGDADILIAATALVYDLPLVTNNSKHFKRIKNLRVENWLKR